MRDQSLTALDGIAVGLVGLLALFLLSFPWVVGNSFEQMFAEFGSVPPRFTQLALKPWFAGSLGVVTACGAAAGFVPGIPLRTRRRVIVWSFFFGCAAIALCMFAMYEPIFDLAGKIKE